LDEQQCRQIKSWFDGYVAGFYGEDRYTNANIKLKDRHSRRVRREMLGLADALGLTDGQKRLAQTIGLLHDVGRFEQFVKYRTYSDVKSVNHCVLGVEILRRADILSALDTGERQIIEKAVEYHGAKELPGGLSDECVLFGRMIRDADKLDVFRVVVRYHPIYSRNPDIFMLEVDLPDEPYCSSEVIEAILSEQLISFHKLRTLNDMKLMQLGWVYDVNFTATLRRIRQRKYLESLVGWLPDTEQVRRVGEKILGYVDSRLNRRE